jgi:O-antigen ligase
MAGLQAFADHPIVGVGTAGFRQAVAPFLGKSYVVGHNAFLSVLVENGLIGFTLYLCIYVYLLRIILHLPPFERRIFLAVLACWFVGSMSLDLQRWKAGWFIIGIIASQVVVADRVPAAQSLGWRLPMQPHGPPRTAS